METIPVVVINYNGKRTVLDTIRSIYEMEDVQVRVYMVDDGSTDGSPDLVSKTFPEVIIQREPKNIGKLNVMRNKALQLVDSKWVLITDNDIIFDKKCLAELLRVMKSDESIATCTPRLMNMDRPEYVYTADTKVHFIGAAIGELRGKKLDPRQLKITSNSGGGIVLLDREKALEVGGYDEDYLMGWGDDGEFYQRLLRAGYKCLFVPSAYALHEEKPFGKLRHYRAVGQIYNRWLFILTHYSIVTLVLLLPAFVLYELMQFAFMTAKKMPHLYIKGNLLVLKNLPLILKKRKKIQKLRKVSDKNVLYSGHIYVAPSVLQNNAMLRVSVGMISIFFNLYWKIVKIFIP